MFDDNGRQDLVDNYQCPQCVGTKQKKGDIVDRRDNRYRVSDIICHTFRIVMFIDITTTTYWTSCLIKHNFKILLYLYYKGGQPTAAKIHAIFRIYNQGLSEIVNDKQLQEVFETDSADALEELMNSTRAYLDFEQRENSASEYATELKILRKRNRVFHKKNRTATKFPNGYESAIYRKRFPNVGK